MSASRAVRGLAACGLAVRGLALLMAAIAAALAAGCFGMRPTANPIPTVTLAEGGPGSRCLLLLLPGRGDSPEDFAAAGFAAIAGDRGIDAEVVAIDSHMGYFRDRSILERLSADVIEPARRRGVEEIWWVGISLGGLASLLVLEARPEAVDGVILLAPFLGEGMMVDSVLAAGDLAAWRPVPGPVTGPEALWRRLWLGLQQTMAEPADRPPIYLGFGDRDRYRAAHRVLAGALPADSVVVVPGGHDWRTWSRLWAEMTADGLPICNGG